MTEILRCNHCTVQLGDQTEGPCPKCGHDLSVVGLYHEASPWQAGMRTGTVLVVGILLSMLVEGPSVKGAIVLSSLSLGIIALQMFLTWCRRHFRRRTTYNEIPTPRG